MVATVLLLAARLVSRKPDADRASDSRKRTRTAKFQTERTSVRAVQRDPVPADQNRSNDFRIRTVARAASGTD